MVSISWIQILLMLGISVAITAVVFGVLVIRDRPPQG